MAFCSAARFTAGVMAGLSPVCPSAALRVVAISSAAVLSAKRLAASCALAAGSADLLSASLGFTEYFGSTKAIAAAFPAFCVGAGVGATSATGAEEAAGTKVVGVEVVGVDTTADASATCGVTVDTLAMATRAGAGT